MYINKALISTAVIFLRFFLIICFIKMCYVHFWCHYHHNLLSSNVYKIIHHTMLLIIGKNKTKYYTYFEQKVIKWSIYLIVYFGKNEIPVKIVHL